MLFMKIIKTTRMDIIEIMETVEIREAVKKVIALCVAFVLTLAVTACGGTAGGTVQGTNNPDGGTFTIEEIQDNSAYYIGPITLIGIVGDSATQDFALQNEAGTFEVFVDYRGSQALPEVGDKIAVAGQLAQNRPCCGPGFTLTSTQFEAVE